MPKLRYPISKDWLFYLLVLSYGYLIFNMTSALWFGGGVNIYESYSAATDPSVQIVDANYVYWSKTCFLFLSMLLFALNFDYRAGVGLAATFWAVSLILMFGITPNLAVAGVLGTSIFVQQIVRKEGTLALTRERTMEDTVPPARVNPVRWWHKAVYWFVIGIYLLAGLLGFGMEIWQALLGDIPKPRDLVVGLSLVLIALSLFSIMGSVIPYRLIAFFLVVSAFFSVLLALANLISWRFDGEEMVGTALGVLLAYGFVRPGTRAYARQVQGRNAQTVDKSHFVYMSASKRNGTLYIGVTNNLVRRVHEHKEGLVEGFSMAHDVKQLVWFETHGSIENAIQREKNLKHWVRQWKIELIEKDNPDWRDLYDEIVG
eukprot:s1_g1191.t1